MFKKSLLILLVCGLLTLAWIVGYVLLRVRGPVDELRHAEAQLALGQYAQVIAAQGVSERVSLMTPSPDELMYASSTPVCRVCLRSSSNEKRRFERQLGRRIFTLRVTPNEASCCLSASSPPAAPTPHPRARQARRPKDSGGRYITPLVSRTQPENQVPSSQ